MYTVKTFLPNSLAVGLQLENQIWCFFNIFNIFVVCQNNRCLERFSWLTFAHAGLGQIT
jgi:hypothetical protein